MTDFSDFSFSNIRRSPEVVYEFGDGVLPKMADVFDVDLSQGHPSEALGRLVGAIGSSKVLQENLPAVQEALGTDQDALGIAAGWLEASGVQKPLDRSLWTPDLTYPATMPVVITGAVANWQDRTANLVSEFARTDVHVVTGNRVMGDEKSPTEANHPNILTYKEEYNGELPSEADYARRFVIPQLENAGHVVRFDPFESSDGEAIARGFFARNPELAKHSFAVARVANAGIQLAVQLRKAAQEINPYFDRNRADLYVVTDGFPIARTADETKKAREFQNPMTGIRQVALTGKLLVEAATAD